MSAFAEQNVTELGLALESFGFVRRDGNWWLDSNGVSHSKGKWHIFLGKNNRYWVKEFVTGEKNAAALRLLGITNTHEIHQLLYPPSQRGQSGPFTAEEWLNPHEDQSDPDLGRRIMQWELGLPENQPPRMPRDWACWKSAPAFFTDKYSDGTSRLLDEGEWTVLVVGYMSLDNTTLSFVELMFYDTSSGDIARQNFEHNNAASFRRPRYNKEYYSKMRSFRMDPQNNLKPKPAVGRAVFAGELPSAVHHVFCEGVFTAAAVQNSISTSEHTEYATFATSNRIALKNIVSNITSKNLFEATHVHVVADMNDVGHSGEQDAQDAAISCRSRHNKLHVDLVLPLIEDEPNRAVDFRDYLKVYGAPAARDLLESGVCPEEYEIPEDPGVAHDFAMEHCKVIASSELRRGTEEFQGLMGAKCADLADSNVSRCLNCSFFGIPGMTPGEIQKVPQFMSDAAFMVGEKNYVYDIRTRSLMNVQSYDWLHQQDPDLPVGRGGTPVKPAAAYPLDNYARIVRSVHNQFTGPPWGVIKDQMAREKILSINLSADFAIKPMAEVIENPTEEAYKELEQECLPYLHVAYKVLGKGLNPISGEVLPTTEMFDYFLWRLSHQIRFPTKKIRTALLLQSNVQQIGKDLLLEAMKSIVGPSNTATVQKDQLSSSKNAHVACAFVHLQEMGLNERQYNEIKTLITDNRVGLRLLYENHRDITNYANVVATTNWRRALPFDPQDARFITHCSAVSEKQRNQLQEDGTYQACAEFIRGNAEETSIDAGQGNEQALQKLATYLWMRFEPFSTRPFDLGEWSHWSINQINIPNNMTDLMMTLNTTQTKEQRYSHKEDAVADAITDAITDCLPPFATCIASIADIKAVIRGRADSEAHDFGRPFIQMPSDRRLGSMLGELGFTKLSPRIKLEYAMLRGEQEVWIKERAIQKVNEKYQKEADRRRGAISVSQLQYEKDVLNMEVLARQELDKLMSRAHTLYAMPINKTLLCEAEQRTFKSVHGNAWEMSPPIVPEKHQPYNHPSTKKFIEWLDIDPLNYKYESRAKLLWVRLHAIDGNSRWLSHLYLRARWGRTLLPVTSCKCRYTLCGIQNELVFEPFN